MSTASVPIQVPRSGFGAPVNVDNLVGEKTVTLSGRYSGAYVLYGSHDGVRFAPLLIFNAGGIESIRQTFKGAFSQLKIKSLASGAAGVVANVSGLSVPGDNSFTSLGVGIVLDLGDDLYQVDLNFMGFGRVNGAVVVEGSLDGNGFNPIGEFASSQAGASLLGIGAIEFSPIATPDRVRYVRLNVQGSAAPGFLVTVGGAQSEAGGTGGSETLAVAYAVGASAFDQTMVVLASKGGKVVFDGTGLLSPTDETAEILGNWVVGPLTIGPYNVGIGQSGHPTINHNPAAINSVIIGADASISGGYSVVVGSGSVSLGGSDVCIGNQATDQDGVGNKVIIGTCTGAGGGSIAIGTSSHADNHGIAVGIGSLSIDGFGFGAGIAVGASASANSLSIALGDGAGASGGGYNNVVIGTNATTDGYSCCVMGVNSSTGTQVNNGIAIGFGAHSVDWNTTAIGTGAIAGSASDLSTVDSVAVGHTARALSASSIAIGPSSTAEGDSTICIGSLASGGDPTSFDNISMGRQAVTANPGDAWGSSNVAIGSPSFTTITNGSVAIGSGANAAGFDHVTHLDVGIIAIGFGADVISRGASIGIGNGVQVYNTSTFPPSTDEPSIGIGSGASVFGAGGAVVVGTSAIANSNQTVTVGMGASTFGDGSVSIGYGSKAGDADAAPSAIAIGINSSAYEDSDIAVGSTAHTDNANPLHQRNIAVGPGAQTSGGSSSIAVGDGTHVEGSNSVVIGYHAVATPFDLAFGTGAIAIGEDSNVIGNRSIAIGRKAEVHNPDGINPADYAIVVGVSSNAYNGGDIVVGRNVKSDAATGGISAILVGNWSSSQGNGCIVLGGHDFSYPVVSASGDNSIAIGTDAQVSAAEGMAIGHGAVAGANEVVFENTGSHVKTFRAVSSQGGHPDLFRFKEADLGVNNVTNFSLLIKGDGGGISIKQVTLSPPVGGVSTLLVSNP